MRYFETGETDGWGPCLVLGYLGLIFKLHDTLLSCSERIVMQIILSHRNTNKLYPAQIHLLIALWLSTSFAPACTFTLALLIEDTCV